MLTISSHYLNYGYAMTKNQQYRGNLCNFFLIIVEKISSKIREFYGDVDHNVSLFNYVSNFS